MAKVDFYKEISTADKTEDLRSNLLDLFDKLMKHVQLTSQEKADILARLRAHIDITLKSF